MIQLHSDPAIAEQQIEALIFYLTTLGYIDSEFDLREKAFVRAFLRELVTARIDEGGPLDPELRFERIENQHEHYVQRFQEIDREIKNLLTEAVADGEDPQRFVVSQLKLRCFEMFRELDEANRKGLLAVVDRFIEADGQVHPDEAAFRNDLAELLGAELILDDSALESVSIEVRDPIQLALPAQDNHPFFAKFEYHYSADPAQLQRQFAADLALLDKVEEKWEEYRVRGRGRLEGHASVADFAGGDEFLDEHVYVLPTRPGRPYELIVLGDLHGCYSCLKAAVHQSNFIEKVRRFKADPDNNPDVRLVLLGDYIDRGRFSYNGVLRTILNLFLAAPDHVFVLRGNHEYYIEYQGKVYGGVRPAEAINSLTPHLGADVFGRFLDFFDAMPNMLLFDQMLFVHAGIPRDSLIAEKWADLSSLNREDIRFQMLWSDPSKAEIVPDELQKASARFAFGRLQFRKFMQRIGCNVLVRGHEKVNAGFKNHYADADVRLFTLFSAGGATNDDLPQDSNYRDVRPMALTVTSKDGLVEAVPWAIDYARYQDPQRNNFFSSTPEIDITPHA
ncbi:Calcineurin-like phosphoesterase [Nannocystis exedens]|uniref:Calcineurin-like phosphoesterase n=1 Tax=Nannocystis exedens TaxID=54 RepID=A0A1I1VR72_9BACT|nr:metallophosphoesterase family protein [Nannocystis exedens]PCC72769.1 serine/threonine protein phosphatase [Nannocystis exedens]SFD85506.1 Calcineurin-like phosphoesterase [Nannocystis exedens]